MGKIAGLLGITIASLGGALSQKINVTQLANKIDAESLNKIEMAIQDPAVEQKLNQLGISDNNIKRAISRLDNKKFKKSVEKKITNDQELVKLLKNGWHLTNVQTDTIINTFQTIAPDIIIDQYILNLGDAAFFESGGYNLSNQEINRLKQVIDSIKQGGNVLLNITVESSTDKQGLSVNLQNKLKTMGYSKDNQGLSKIRNNNIKQILTQLGIDSSLISQTILSEQGSQTIDQNARYVRVRFNIKKFHPDDVQKIQKEYIPEYKNTYNLMYLYSKQNIKKQKKQIKLPSCKIKIKLFKKKTYCPTYQ